MKWYRQGDQFVTVYVFTPQNLTKEEKQMLEKLRTAPNFQPGADATKGSSFFNRMKDMFE